MVGTMIELPRAALQAGRIARVAEFFSFGTNDLTQTTFGLSRDDAGSFLNDYEDKGILEVDPFVSLDQERSEEHTSELQSLMRISYAVFCLKKKTIKNMNKHT